MQFSIREKDLKKYPHFDQIISREELIAIVTNPDRVRTNAFFPFIQYEKKYQPFRDRPKKPKKKKRLIRYASRRDAVIYTYYRHLLSPAYEKQLIDAGLGAVPTAYRKIPISVKESGGKCNIDFAADVFDEIKRQQNCVVVTLDISKFFECIDHNRLYKVWCSLLGVLSLPQDHLAVFKSITQYVVVDRDALYERLGYIGRVKRDGGAVTKGYLESYKNMPKQLCSMKEFRAKVIGEDGEHETLCQPKNEDCGIPQGAPLSDLLANAYLFEFDQELNNYAVTHGGKYWRYSDDMILVLPGDEGVGRSAQRYAQSAIKNAGEELQIKASKSSVIKFEKSSTDGQTNRLVDGKQGRNGLEYLGFRFDGKKVFLRDSTVANFYRKITRRARRQASRYVSRYDGKTVDWLVERFDFGDFEKRFGRVSGFESLSTKKSWTFWTYARRSSDKFGKSGLSILRQIKDYRKFVRCAVRQEIERAIRRKSSSDNGKNSMLSRAERRQLLRMLNPTD